MNHQTIKKFSNEEIEDFYNKYFNKQFQNKIRKIEDKYFKIGIVAISLSFILCLISFFFSPWSVFVFLPGYIIPTSTLFLSHHKIKKEVNKLSQTIKYEDFIKLVENNAFAKIKHLQSTPDKLSETKQAYNKSSKQQKILEKDHNDDLTL